MKFWRLRAQRPLWLIEKARPGRYHNFAAGRLWSDCGFIRADNREQAAIAGAFAVGSSLVRVTPGRMRRKHE